MRTDSSMWRIRERIHLVHSPNEHTEKRQRYIVSEYLNEWISGKLMGDFHWIIAYSHYIIEFDCVSIYCLFHCTAYIVSELIRLRQSMMYCIPMFLRGSQCRCYAEWLKGPVVDEPFVFSLHQFTVCDSSLSIPGCVCFILSRVIILNIIEIPTISVMVPIVPIWCLLITEIVLIHDYEHRFLHFLYNSWHFCTWKL